MRLKIGNAYRGTEIMAEVVGVVMTGKMFLLTEPFTQAIYLLMWQNFHERMTLVAETVGDLVAMAAPLQAMVHTIDPQRSAAGAEDRVRKSDRGIYRFLVGTELVPHDISIFSSQKASEHCR